jgi:hypothetical protein
MLVGIVAACGGDGSDESGSAVTTETTAETTTSTTAASTTSTLPTAADGTDLAACADGNCEVEVSGPVDISLTGHASGITTLSVIELVSDGFSFTMASNGSERGSGDLRGGCILTFYSSGGGSSCPGPDQELPPPAPEAGALAMQLVGARDGTVVFRLVSG